MRINPNTFRPSYDGSHARAGAALQTGSPVTRDAVVSTHLPGTINALAALIKLAGKPTTKKAPPPKPEAPVDRARQQKRAELDQDLAKCKAMSKSHFTQFMAHDIAVGIANDPAKLALLTRDERLMLVKALFAGDTNETEEDAAVKLLLSGTSRESLRSMVDSLGWEKLDDELDAGDLDKIAQRLAQVPTKGDELAAKVVAELGLDWNNLDLVKLSKALAGLSPQKAQALATRLLQGGESLVASIEKAHQAGKPSAATQMMELLEGLASRVGNNKATADNLRELSREVRYTNKVAGALARGDFGALLSSLGDLAKPGSRTALLDVLNRHADQIRAMVDLVNTFGSGQQRADAQSFLRAMEVGRDAAAAGKSPDEILTDILHEAIGIPLEALATSVDGLINEVHKVGNELSQKLNLWALVDFNSLGDDKARDLIKQLHAKGLLHTLPVDKKVELARAILNTPFTDGVLDDDEQALLLLLGETKKHDPAQFYQMVAAIGWGELDDHIDGTEHDDLLTLCDPSHQPI